MSAWGLSGLVARVRDFSSDRRGNAAMIFALSAVPLFGVAGALLDYSRAAATRNSLQSALDASVIAGLRAAPGGRAAATRSAFLARFPAQRAAVTELLVAEPRNGEPLTASAKASVSSAFGGFLGSASIAIAANAQARFSLDDQGADARPHACLLLMDASAPQALDVRPGADIRMPSCEAHVRSSAAVAAAFERTRFEARRVCLAGSGYLAVGANQLGPIETNCRAANDPFRDAGPSTIGCNFTDLDLSSGPASVTLDPGGYCGATRFRAGQSVSFRPGLYVLRGGAFRFPAGVSLTGDGVSFFFADPAARFEFSGSADIALSAPSDGIFRDVLMNEPVGLARSGFELGAEGQHALAGLIHLPSRDAVLRGRFPADPTRVSLVLNRLVVMQAAQLRLATSPRRIEIPDTGGAGPIISLSR